MARFLSITEAAEVLGVSRPHLYRMAQDGELRSVRIGRRVLIPKMEIDRLESGDANQDEQAISGAA